MAGKVERWSNIGLLILNDVWPTTTIVLYQWVEIQIIDIHRSKQYVIKPYVEKNDQIGSAFEEGKNLRLYPIYCSSMGIYTVDYSVLLKLMDYFASSTHRSDCCTAICQM